jgi:hypothetical protein
MKLGEKIHYLREVEGNLRGLNRAMTQQELLRAIRSDPALRQSLLRLARHEDTRRCLLLLEAVMETPGLVDRLLEVLRPGHAEEDTKSRAARKQSRKESQK